MIARKEICEAISFARVTGLYGNFYTRENFGNDEFALSRYILQTVCKGGGVSFQGTEAKLFQECMPHEHLPFIRCVYIHVLLK